MTRLEHVFRLVAETPWAIRPEVLSVICDLITYRRAGHRLTDEEIEIRISEVTDPVELEAARARPRSDRRGAVALLSLYGVIAPRASMVDNVSGPSGTGLDAFSANLDQALDDPDVASIVIDVNSPGGTVDMVPETADRIRAGRARKPILAVANTDAASAAYWLASQATELVVTPSGMVGSVGVYAAHENRAGELEQRGRKVTLISAGKFKVEGNPFEELGEEARADIQKMVDTYYGMFVDGVAKGRGVKASVVRSGYGEGRMLSAKEALAEGMVDRIETLEQAVARALRGGPFGARARSEQVGFASVPAGMIGGRIASAQPRVEIRIEGDPAKLEAAFAELEEPEPEPEPEPAPPAEEVALDDLQYLHL